MRQETYPPIEPYDSGMLALDDTHIMYWEQSGNPNGVPVVFLHGGPGAGTSPKHRRFFDPAHYRIILFDQRGSGKSLPLGEAKNNTTQHLVSDIETLRRMLDIENWLVFGGSWGSTLALVYAIMHPARVTGLILRGIFLCRKSEIDWFFYGMRNVFPEAWEEFVSIIPESERGDLLSAYHKRLFSENKDSALAAARNYSKYEGACSTLLPNPTLVQNFMNDTVAIGLARMEAHYFKNNIFLPENYILDNIEKIRDIPGIIVQGRYDMPCPAISAHDLKRGWPKADLRIIPDAGHSAYESGICAELVKATEAFKR